MGTADAVRAAIDQIGAEDTVVVLNGDAPLITAESLRALVESHERSGAAATIATMVLDDPSGYGRVVRAARRDRGAGGGDQGGGRRHRGSSCASARSTPGCSPSTAPRWPVRCSEVRADNAQGEHYLPDVLPILRAHERTVGAYELSDPDELLGINDRVQLAEVAARGPAPHPRAPHARRGDDRQPRRRR